MNEIWWIGNILTTTFEFYLFDDFMSNVFREKTNRYKYRGVLYLISGTTLMIINTFQIVWLDMTILSFAYFLLLSMLFVNSKFEKVFYIIAFLFPLAAIESIVRNTCYAAFSHITPIGFILINIISVLAAFIVEKIYLIFICKNYEKTYQKWYSFFLILPLIYLFVLIEFLTPAFHTKAEEVFPIAIVGCAMLFANTVSFYLFEKMIQTLGENKNQSLYIQNLSMNENYYKMIEKNNENLSLILHDFKHHIHTITSMARDEKSNEILNYLSILEPNYKLANTVQYTDNNIINIILSEKQSIAKAKGISFRFDITPCRLSFLDIVVSCSLFSNLLDNAIEAAEQCCQNGYVNLRIAQFNNHYVIVQIENPFFRISKGIHGLHTTKNDTTRHGYGLKQIANVVEEQGGVFTYEDKNNVFSVVVMLKCD